MKFNYSELGSIAKAMQDADAHMFNLSQENQRLEKALEQATRGMYLAEVIGPGRKGTIWRAPGVHAPTRRLRADDCPELAAYLRAQSEAKQAEQTATQPASTNQASEEQI